MTEDARFEDGGERPLRLKALDADDMPIVSALVLFAGCAGRSAPDAPAASSGTPAWAFRPKAFRKHMVKSFSSKIWSSFSPALQLSG